MAYYYSPFRKEYKTPTPSGCPFCNETLLRKQAVFGGDNKPVENKYYRWIVNWYPKYEGHTMLVPKRHIVKLGEETDEEVVARHQLSVLAATALQRVYPGSGIEIFLQTGEGSESSIPHTHWHIGPSLTDDPIRGFNKLGQFYTTEDGKEKIVLFPVPIRLAREDLRYALSEALKDQNY